MVAGAGCVWPVGLCRPFDTPVGVAVARVRIELPQSFRFTTEIQVRINDVNYGGHLGNDSLLSILQEARVRMLKDRGWSELNVGGVGLIMSDAAVMYRSEAFHGDMLRIDLDTADFSSTGCDLLYRVTNASTGKEVARAKTGITFFDYSTRKVVPVPAVFREAFS